MRKYRTPSITTRLVPVKRNWDGMSQREESIWALASNIIFSLRISIFPNACHIHKAIHERYMTLHILKVKVAGVKSVGNIADTSHWLYIPKGITDAIAENITETRDEIKRI